MSSNTYGNSDLRRRAVAALAGACLACLASAGARAQATAPAAPALPAEMRVVPGQTTDMVVPLFKSRVVSLAAPAARVAVGNPDIADIVVIGPTELYVLGKDIGTTNVLLWSRENKLVGSLSVEVTHELIGLRAKLLELFPRDAIEVRSVQRSIVLTGRVSDVATMNAAVRLAEGYLAQIQPGKKSKEFEQDSASRREDRSVGNVINLLQVAGSQQVMLQVKVAEIERSELRRISAKFNAMKAGSPWSVGGVNGGARFPDLVLNDSVITNPVTGVQQVVKGGRVPVFDGVAPAGPAIDEFAPQDMTIENQGLFASYLSREFMFNMALDAAKEKGLAKILAEPNLTTQTGQEAQFLSGGEFPIPVPNGLEGVTIEFKEFGVGLKFLPTVLSGDRINLKLNVSVSELVEQNSVLVRANSSSGVFSIPSLAKRSASGTVELGDGQTIVLAGMLNDSLRQLVTKFPGLGSIPVIGALFRSQNFLKGETELVILVTPRLAKPISPQDVRLPTDKFVEPSDTDFYLFGRTEGTATPDAAPRGEADSKNAAAAATQGAQR